MRIARDVSSYIFLFGHNSFRPYSVRNMAEWIMAEYDSAFAHNPFGHNPDGIWANRIIAESDYGRIGLCAKTLNWVWLIVGLNCDLACPCTICNCSWILRIMCEMSIKAKIYIIRCPIVSFNVENCIACALFFSFYLGVHLARVVIFRHVHSLAQLSWLVMYYFTGWK